MSRSKEHGARITSETIYLVNVLFCYAMRAGTPSNCCFDTVRVRELNFAASINIYDVLPIEVQDKLIHIR